MILDRFNHDDFRATLRSRRLPEQVNDGLYFYLESLGYFQSTLQDKIRAANADGLDWAAIGYEADVVRLFSAGETGVFYDPSDFSTMFQDSAGTTPVTAVEQTVGLLLDKSKGLVLGPEKFPAAALTSTAGWGAVTNGTLQSVNGELVLTATAAGLCYVDYSFATSVGANNVLTATGRRGQAAGTQYIGLAVGTVPYAAFANSQTNNNVRLQKAAVATPEAVRIRFDAAAGGESAIFSSISVRELPGNHATQATSTARPVLRARYNLLTYSEQFDNAAWAAKDLLAFGGGSVANAIVAPDGTTTAELIVPNTVNTDHRSTYTATLVAGATYTFAVKYKDAGYPRVDIAVFGVTSGTLYAGTINITSVENGFSQATKTFTVAAGDSSVQIRLLVTNGVSQSFAGDGVSGVYVWGAQLNTGSTPTAYQRIAAATDYDTVGFKPYLDFDGVDDFLVTSAIDFTGTDKMSVFAGVTKDSDAAAALAVELSVASSTNAGTFSVSAPSGAAATNFAFRSRGANDSLVSDTNYASPVTAVITGTGDISGDLTRMRVNGGTYTSSLVDQGVGNFGNYPLYLGMRAGTSLPFNGRIYSLIVRGALSDAAQIAAAESYVASKTGVALG